MDEEESSFPIKRPRARRSLALVLAAVLGLGGLLCLGTSFGGAILGVRVLLKRPSRSERSLLRCRAA